MAKQKTKTAGARHTDAAGRSPAAPASAPLLESHLLQLVEALYATQSVTRAAERLGQSQPTLSIWLGRLRTQLGDPLFVRTPRGMLPTPRIEALIGDVRSALAALRQLTTPETFDPTTATREFRIFMTDASHVTLLPQLFSQVRTLAPGVRLEAASIDASVATALQSGDADLALGLLPGLEAGFYQQALFAQDWVCLVNPQHPRLSPRAKRVPAFTLAQYATEPHVSIVSGTGQQLIERALARRSLRRTVLLELPGFLGLSAILSTTDLVATLPRHIGTTLAQAADLYVLPCPVVIDDFTVKQYWHARYHHDAGNRWLRGLCATLFQTQVMPGSAAKDGRGGLGKRRQKSGAQ